MMMHKMKHKAAMQPKINKRAGYGVEGTSVCEDEIVEILGHKMSLSSDAPIRA